MGAGRVVAGRREGCWELDWWGEGGAREEGHRGLPWNSCLAVLAHCLCLTSLTGSRPRSLAHTRSFPLRLVWRGPAHHLCLDGWGAGGQPSY